MAGGVEQLTAHDNGEGAGALFLATLIAVLVGIGAMLTQLRAQNATLET